MNKKLIAFFSMAVIGISTLEHRAIAGSETSTADLRNYSIKFIPHRSEQDLGEAERFIKHTEIMANAEPAMFACRDAFPSKPATRYLTLRRPAASNIVAIVKVDTAGQCVLNPDGWGDYGPVPPLGALSLSQTDLLWGGREIERNETSRSYDLIFIGKNSTTTFHLDVEFQNQRVFRYKVRCDSDKTILPEWHSV
ncbi:MAG: hypothetical protein U0103_29320 [Candidatus Obscuribacterales bacterium]